MKPLMCRLQVINGKLEFDSVTPLALTLDQQIQEDKKYGVMTPANQKYFTYQAMDWKNDIINSKEIQNAVRNSWQAIERRLDFKVQRAAPGEIIDFKVYFRSTIDDPDLTSNTLMYHFYPINDINSEFRGVCVVNTDFPFSVDGKSVDMHYIDPGHYPNVGSGLLGGTYDFDQIYGRHEVCHGLGLPHSTHSGTTMYFSYGGMVEYFDDEDPQETFPRLVAKYGEKSTWEKFKIRWIQWERVRYDNY